MTTDLFHDFCDRGSERKPLVCCYDRPEFVKAELEVATRDRKLAVFGRQDLVNLGQKLADWIVQNN